jgi:hypothetical protein
MVRYYAPPHDLAVRTAAVLRSLTLLEMLTSARRSFADLSRVSRELIVLGGALIVGLVVVPLAIWFAGNRILGPYTHGTNTHAGPMALLGDFFSGLAHGLISFWVVALGPAVIILFARLVLALFRYQPRPTTPPRR